MQKCFFCNYAGGRILFSSPLYRINLVEDNYYPGYIRIILNRHVVELTDLNTSENLSLYQAVINCEKIIRHLFNPDKVNVASLGNITPHIHWHIIPRYRNDRHFPNSIWSELTNPLYKPLDSTKFAQKKMLDKFEQLFNALGT